MALTKSDKAEIKKMIREALMEPQDTAVELPTWEPKVLKKSRILGIEIASEDYREIAKNGEKKELFTWDEAMKIEKKLRGGWRLPTRSEWVVLAEEFGVDDSGKLDKDIFMKNLSMNYTGYMSGDMSGGHIHLASIRAYYWSRTDYSNSFAYSLNIYSNSYFNPQNNDHSKDNGFAVRLVRDMEAKNDN